MAIRKFAFSVVFIIFCHFISYSQGVNIGNQVWMARNLDVSNFRNGDVIVEAKSEEEWYLYLNSQTPAFCYYNYNKRNGIKYGKLYNWYAVTDYRGLSPIGWRIPASYDFEILTKFLNRNAGLDLKSFSWIKEIYATTESIKQINPGFNALPGGFKIPSGSFGYIGEVATFWSCTLYNSSHAYCLDLLKGTGGYVDCCEYSYIGISGGASVRCIKDN